MARDALEFMFPQITTGDLDIPIIGQLPAANLPLSDEVEPRPVNVIASTHPSGVGPLDAGFGTRAGKRAPPPHIRRCRCERSAQPRSPNNAV
jgi:hypothetical protein